jgi:TolB-like protein
MRRAALFRCRVTVTVRRTLAAALLCAGSACATGGSRYDAREAVRADRLVQIALASEAAVTLAAPDIGTVAVLPLEVDTDDTSLQVLGFGLAELLATDLKRYGRLRVVERTRIDALLRELQLAASGRVDSATAPRAGRLIGAGRVIAGRVRIPPDRSLQLNARVANAMTGRVESALDATSGLDEILVAQRQLTFRVFDALGVPLTPRDRAELARSQTRDLVALLAYSRGMQAQAQLDFSGAASFFREAVRRDPQFGAARVAAYGSMADATVSADPIVRASETVLNTVNRPIATPVGTIADAPVAVTQRQVTFIIRVVTP